MEIVWPGKLPKIREAIDFSEAIPAALDEAEEAICRAEFEGNYLWSDVVFG